MRKREIYLIQDFIKRKKNKIKEKKEKKESIYIILNNIKKCTIYKESL